MTALHTPEELHEMAEVLRRVAEDGEEILRSIACPKGEACDNCTRKWNAVHILRKAADYINSQAVVH